MNDALIGRKLAHYRIERFLGRGGMAQVYYAWDESLERPAAVKVINEALRGDSSYTERFVQEARAIARWRHPNVLQVYYAGEQDDLYFFAMEYIDGLNLEQVLGQYADEGELVAHDDVLHMGRAIASALDYAHSKHVIHRDVKPSNVMINAENRVVLADFGLAMDVQRGTLGETFGTPHYVSPEQAQNSADAVPQSDIYSLGIILYEMLVGVVPFDDPSSMSIAIKHITEPPPAPRTINPQLSEGVANVLLKALEKEPAARYASGKALMDALADAIQAQSEGGDKLFALPPPPAGAASPQTSPPQSQLSIVDRVALSAPQPPSPPAPDGPETGSDRLVRVTPPASQQGSGGSRTTRSASQWLGLGGVGIIVFLVLAAATFLLLPGSEGAERTPEVSEVAASGATEPASGEAAEASVVPATATATSRPSSTATPTERAPVEDVQPTQTPVPTATAAPTEPAPTDRPTAEPTAVPPSPTAPQATPEPTIAFPNGREVTLAYNAHSFYLHNPSSQRLSLTPMRFEALDEAGAPLPFAMSGTVWTQFYPFVEANSCVRVEPWGGADDFLYPAFCTNYNASHRPQPGADELFWAPRPGVDHFRVLWDDQEVARCALAETTCTILVPAP